MRKPIRSINNYLTPWNIFVVIYLTILVGGIVIKLILGNH